MRGYSPPPSPPGYATKSIALNKEGLLISSRVCLNVFDVYDLNKLSDQHFIKVMTVTVNECPCAFSFLHE